jgi:hypothetical protein
MPFDDPKSLNNFLDFINTQLDLSALDAEAPPRLSEIDIQQRIMPLIREDIHRETLQIVHQLLRNPQRNHWQAQLAPLHREVRECLAQTIGGIMELHYPDRLNQDEWIDVTSFVIALAWLVRKQIDSDDLPAFDAS